MTKPENLLETYRGVVAPWECDVMGHLTIAFYFDRFTEAAFNLIEQLAPALPPAAAWRSSRVLVRYQQELRAGDGLVIRSGVIGHEGETLRIGHELVNAATNEVATLAEHEFTPRDLPYGGRAEQRRALFAAAVAWNSPGFEPMTEPAVKERMVPAHADRVKASEVDERGELSLAGYVHRFAFAAMHLLSSFGMSPPYMRRHKRGLSTFDTRLKLLAPAPGAGDGVRVRSGLLGVGNSSLRAMHELYHAKSGERLAVMFQSAVHFDMETRRSAPLPAELKERAAALVLS